MGVVQIRKPFIILMVFLLVPAFTSADLTSGLTQYLSFDNLFNASVGTDASSNGGYSVVAGKIGNAVSLTSDTTYIDVGMKHGDADLSVSCWLKPSNFPNNDIYMGGWQDANQGYWQIVGGELKIYAESNSVTGASFGAIGTGAWHHIVASNNGSDYDIYLDGSTSGTTAGSSAADMFGSTYNVRIGKQTWYGYSLDGAVDECAFWSRPLSPDDVAELWNSGSGLAYPFSAGETAFSITASDFGNFTLSNFSANVNGTEYTTTSGTIDTDFNQSQAIYMNITLNSSENGGYFNKTYQDFNISANLAGVLFQTDVKLSAYEYISGNLIGSIWRNSTGQTIYTPLHWRADLYNISFNNDSYFNMTQELNFTPLLNVTFNYTNVYANLINITVFNAYSLQTLNNFNGWALNLDESYNQSFTTNNGYAEVAAINGNYTLFVNNENYSYSIATNFKNVTVAGQVYNASFGLWSNNSIRVRIYDEQTTNLITGINISMVLTGNSTEVTRTTTNGLYLFENITDGNYTVKFSGGNYTTKTYSVTVADRSSQELNAYLSSNYQTVTFTISDYATGANIEGSSFTAARLLNSTWQTVESKTSDITGRVQISYLPNVKYRFTITMAGYTSKVFYLDPVIFSSYTVYLVPVASPGQEDTFQGVSLVYYPYVYQNEAGTNFTFTISSPGGALTQYGFNLTYPGGSVQDTGTLAIGESFTTQLNITGASIVDVVNFTYWFDTTLNNLEYYNTNFGIIGATGLINGTWFNLRQNPITGLGDFEKVLIILGIVIIFAGVGYALGGEPAAVVTGILAWALGSYLAFVNLWTVLPALLVGLVYLWGGRR